jgi:ComF family protein
LNLKFKKLSYLRFSALSLKLSIFSMIKNIINGIVDFILPAACLHCQAAIDTAINGDEVKFICSKCYSRLERFSQPHPWGEEYSAKGVIDGSFSAFWFREGSEIQTLMHEMKYGKLKSVGRLFGREIGNAITAQNKIQWDYIIPVPLHKARLRDRTYNQSEYIAKGIKEVIKTEVLADGVHRTRFTGTQTKLNKPQRRENVKDAFEVNPKHRQNINNKNIVVVDDVITTGATILECAQTIKLSGAGKVMVCSAAYAELSIIS